MILDFLSTIFAHYLVIQRDQQGFSRSLAAGGRMTYARFPSHLGSVTIPRSEARIIVDLCTPSHMVVRDSVPEGDYVSQAVGLGPTTL